MESPWQPQEFMAATNLAKVIVPVARLMVTILPSRGWHIWHFDGIDKAQAVQAPGTRIAGEWPKKHLGLMVTVL